MNELDKLNNLDIKDYLSKEEQKQLQVLIGEAGIKDWVYDPSDGSIKLNVKFINKSQNPDPSYQKEGDSGFDFMADFSRVDGEPINYVTLLPQQRALIPTGLFFQIPVGFELQVRPRSGLALKHGITVLNTPGTVDSGYRGEVCVILYNTGTDPFIINKGDRIAQGIIAPVQTKKTTQFTRVESLDDSDRGAGGFGSTGI